MTVKELREQLYQVDGDGNMQVNVIIELKKNKTCYSVEYTSISSVESVAISVGGTKVIGIIVPQ